MEKSWQLCPEVEHKSGAASLLQVLRPEDKISIILAPSHPGGKLVVLTLLAWVKLLQDLWVFLLFLKRSYYFCSDEMFCWDSVRNSPASSTSV